MAQEASVKVESIETLTKETNVLKAKLEDERQKLNDVTCEFTYFDCIIWWLMFVQVLVKFSFGRPYSFDLVYLVLVWELGNPTLAKGKNQYWLMVCINTLP